MQVPTQPALLGISAWPGWLTLTNFDLYFESLGVGVNEKAVRYDLATDLKQVIKSELIGPLGARFFDKAVMYKSTTLTISWIYLWRPYERIDLLEKQLQRDSATRSTCKGYIIIFISVH